MASECVLGFRFGDRVALLEPWEGMTGRVCLRFGSDHPELVPVQLDGKENRVIYLGETHGRLVHARVSQLRRL
jgi:hypothetical protein